jgi:hypothetical protein
MIVGLSEVHGISKGRAIIAVLLPSIVCCGLPIAVFAALVASAGGVSELLKIATENQ